MSYIRLDIQKILIQDKLSDYIVTIAKDEMIRKDMINMKEKLQRLTRFKYKFYVIWHV